VPATVFGLPTHVLVIHAVVVFVPLAVLTTVALAVSSRVRRDLGWAVVAIDTIALVSVPIATSTGEALQARVPDTALVQRHAELGGQLLPLVAVLWVAAVGVHLIHRRRAQLASSGPGAARLEPAWLSRVGRVAAVVSVLAALASAVQVVRIGDAGARAAWSHRVSSTPHAADGG
jgi:hypothetical protein